MAQWLITLVVFAEDPGSIPSIHMVVINKAHMLIYNSASRGSNAFSDQDLLRHQTHIWNTYAPAGKTIILIKKSFSKKLEMQI